ncbi:hypothetical protein GGI25_001649 [Coemansia spiralis]|uniref:CUE domain-containing protein n=2 Tax=Coemansia TaxID=4863 RepID=A0A9W8KZA9_9FUNG|nr:hypothetical protein GGI25_001649 [Coemansia spiralis]
MGWKSKVRFQIMPYIARDWQVWRAALSLFVFDSFIELATGVALVYQLRRIERIFGTRKFASFLFVAGLVGQTLSIAAVCLLACMRATVFASILANVAVARASGPFVLLFASLHQFYTRMPVLERRRSFGVEISDKAVLYFMAANFLVLRLFVVLVPMAVGIAASMIYNANVAGLKYWRFPQWMTHVACTLVLPWISSSSEQSGGSGRLVDMLAARNAAVQRSLEQLRQHQQMHQQMAEEPAEELVVQLQSMFPNAGREQVVQALQLSRNDPNRAAAIILEH